MNNKTWLDKEKLLERINAIANMFYEQGNIKDSGLFVILRDEIETGTFDAKCPDCGGSGRNEMCDDPYYSEPCACTVDWMHEACESGKEANQLREDYLYAIHLLEFDKNALEEQDALIERLRARISELERR